MRGTPTLLLAALLIIGGGAATTGCSSSTTTHTVERPATNGDAAATQTETTTTETHETSGPGVGIVSGTVHVIGMVLALPFKIIGGLLELIF